VLVSHNVAVAIDVGEDEIGSGLGDIRHLQHLPRGVRIGVAQDQVHEFFGEQHPLYAYTISSIGSIYQKQGKFQESEEKFLFGLSLQEKLIGDHPEKAITMSQLGSLYLRQGLLDKAENYYNQALQIRERIYGVEHDDYATSLTNIGSVLQKKKDFNRALEYYAQAYQILEKSLWTK